MSCVQTTKYQLTHAGGVRDAQDNLNLLLNYLI